MNKCVFRDWKLKCICKIFLKKSQRNVVFLYPSVKIYIIWIQPYIFTNSSSVVPMSECGFRALSRVMFSLFGLQPDPLVLLIILGYKMPCTAKVKVGNVPRQVHSQLINQHEQEKWETEDEWVWDPQAVVCRHWRPIIPTVWPPVLQSIPFSSQHELPFLGSFAQ